MKKYLILVLIVLVMGALFIGVLAEKPGNVPHGPAGESNIAHAYLYEKDANWDIVDGGAWGKMTYNLSGSTFDFVFNGHGLEDGVEYCLIYYVDPGPGTWTEFPDIICLGNGIANSEGDVHIADSVVTGDLPFSADENYPEGAKIWLVLFDDVDCGDPSFMFGWHPTEYLFEYDLITFTEE
jgi:hypothetical protein